MRNRKSKQNNFKLIFFRIKKTNVHDFEVGSEIIYNGHPGVIKWIGYPPGCKEKMAGLEMVKYAHTYSDS